MHNWIQIDITSTAKSLECSSGHHWYVQTFSLQQKITLDILQLQQSGIGLTSSIHSGTSREHFYKFLISGYLKDIHYHFDSSSRCTSTPAVILIGPLIRETLIWFASAPGPGARIQTGCPKYGPPARADTQILLWVVGNGRRRRPQTWSDSTSWSKNTHYGSRLTDQEFWGTIFGVCRTDMDSRKSTSGTVTSALGVPLAFNSRTQSTVATSSAEAELYAIGLGISDSLHIYQLLQELHQHLQRPTFDFGNIDF